MFLGETSLVSTVLRFVINYLVRLAFAVIFIYSSWIPLQNLRGWFSYHVILCTLGYIPLMAEAIMLFVGDDIWSRHLSRKSKYWVHGILISFSTVLIIIGNGLVFHYISPGYHLYTAHGITGLVSMIILIISLIMGLMIQYPQYVSRLVTIRPVTYKFTHNMTGILGYVIGIVSLCFAYYTKWFMYYNGEESRLAALIVTILISLWPLNGAILSLYHQFKSMIS